MVASSDLLSSLNANLHLSLQGTPLSAMEGQAFRAVVKLVRAMCDNGRRINFIGLTGTMLSNDDAVSLPTLLVRCPSWQEFCRCMLSAHMKSWKDTRNVVVA